MNSKHASFEQIIPAASCS